MKNNNNRILIIYFALLFIFVIGSLGLALFIIPNYFKEYARIASLLVWVGLFAISTQIPNEHGKFKGKNEKVKTTIIIVIVFYIVYFLLGLSVGFKANPYSNKFFAVIQNAFFIVGVALLQEYVRSKVINNKKKISTYVLITIFFIIINIDFQEIISIINNINRLFEYLFSTIVPQIAISVLCTYLAVTGGYQLIYAYIIPIKIVEILAPVFPDLNWFLYSIFNIILVMILVFYNNYEHTIKTTRLTRRQLRKENPIKLIPVLSLVLFFVLFVAGVFPMKPVAVMSNSMVPVFSRGSVVVTEKIGNSFNKIKKGDIIEFKTEKGTVIHRVVEIEMDQNGKYMYTTKGDMNLTNDTVKINQENVIGVEKFSVPYLGYPSVLFSENVLGRKAIIQL